MPRITHGGYIGGKELPMHYIWRSMLIRCDKNHKNYEHVRVCRHWCKYENFVADMGERPTPKHTLDRWPNPFGNYEPTNCRWATWSQQHRNKRATKLFSDGKREGCIAQWSKWLGLSRPLLRYRWTKCGTLVPGKTFVMRTFGTEAVSLPTPPSLTYHKNSRLYECDGTVKSLSEWARDLKITKGCAWRRMKTIGTFERGKNWNAHPGIS
jgi:hypothetical protein